MGQETLQQAHSHRVAGEYEPAIELYRQVLQAEPAHAEALWGLGLSLMNTGEFDDATAALEAAVKADPENGLYLVDVGKHYTMLGMYDEAKPFFDKIIELDPNGEHAGEARKQLSYY